MASPTIVEMIFGNVLRPASGDGGITPIIDNLLSSSTTSALSANQGRVLKQLIDLAATQQWVNQQITALVNGAPGLLDQLNEFAAALGNDPNFAATMLNALAGKQPTLGFTPENVGNKAQDLTAPNNNKYPTTLAVVTGINEAVQAIGAGDMAKATYDTDGDGVVDNSERLAGQMPTYFLDRGNHTGNVPAANIVESALKRFVTDVLISAWNSKADGVHTHQVADVNGLTEQLGTLIGDISALEVGKADSVHDHTIAQITNLQAVLDTKATPADISTAINALVAGAPGLLDTLNEIATALGNDPNFAATITAALAGKEPTISQGAAGQYYSWNKTWQALNKAAVGLGNIDNTSDANKPVSTAVQTALNSKANASHSHNMADISGLEVALSAKANTSSLSIVALSNDFDDLDNKPRYEVLTTLPADLSGYPDGSEIYVTG